MGRKKSGKKENKKDTTVSQPISPKLKTPLTLKVEQLFEKFSQKTSLPGTPPTWENYVEIYELLQEIRILEKDIHLPEIEIKNRGDLIDPFLTWLQEHKVKVGSVKMIDYGCEGLGLEVGSSIAEGDEVFRVPKSIILSEESAKTSVLGPLLESDQILKHMSNVSLSLHLLCEASNPDSVYAPYLLVLPQVYSTTLYFTPDQMKLLKGSPTQGDALKHFNSIARQYAYFYRILQTKSESCNWPIKNHFSYDTYRWAVSTVMTRLNRIPAEGGTFQLALIPGWDMANHEYGKFSTDYNDESEEVVCFAHRQYEPREQFKIYYGPRTSSEFFLHNEFVYKDNPDDSYPLRLGVSKNDPLYSKKVSLLAALKLPPTGFYPLLPGDQPISPGLLAFTLIFCMDEATINEQESDTEKVSELQYEDKIAAAEQKKAWTFLLTRFSLLCAAYPTKLEDDQAALNSLPKVEKLISSLVIEEKKMLHNAIKYLKLKIELLVEKK